MSISTKTVPAPPVVNQRRSTTKPGWVKLRQVPRYELTENYWKTWLGKTAPAPLITNQRRNTTKPGRVKLRQVIRYELTENYWKYLLQNICNRPNNNNKHLTFLISFIFKIYTPSLSSD